MCGAERTYLPYPAFFPTGGNANLPRHRNRGMHSGSSTARRGPLTGVRGQAVTGTGVGPPPEAPQPLTRVCLALSRLRYACHVAGLPMSLPCGQKAPPGRPPRLAGGAGHDRPGGAGLPGGQEAGTAKRGGQWPPLSCPHACPPLSTPIVPTGTR